MWECESWLGATWEMKSCGGLSASLAPCAASPVHEAGLHLMEPRPRAPKAPERKSVQHETTEHESGSSQPACLRVPADTRASLSPWLVKRGPSVSGDPQEATTAPGPLSDGLACEIMTLHSTADYINALRSRQREWLWHHHQYTSCRMLREMQGGTVLDQCHLFVFLFEMNWGEKQRPCRPPRFLWIFVYE